MANYGKAMKGLKSVKGSGEGRTVGKRSDPDFSPTTVFLRKATKLEAAAIKANQRVSGGEAGDMDLSDLLQSLLQEWVAKQKAGKQ